MILRWITPIAGTGLAIVVVFWLYRDLDIDRFITAVADANTFWLVALVAAILFEQLVREWRAGRIAGFRLRFNLEGRPRAKAAPANIEPREDAEVWGGALPDHATRTRPFERDRGDPEMALPANLA